MPEEFLEEDDACAFGSMTQEHYDAWRHIERGVHEDKGHTTPATPRPPGPSLLPRPRRHIYAGGGMHKGMPPPPPFVRKVGAQGHSTPSSSPTHLTMQKGACVGTAPPAPSPICAEGGRNEGTPPRLSALPPSPSLFAPPYEQRNEGTPTAPPLRIV
ncbi:hypothetical protein EDB83DRAFT_2521293 [Lactarius deliciosus]|nr:hypothetical protein EDB83DRAFT_2521293 [Lactarius deliciosus]